MKTLSAAMQAHLAGNSHRRTWMLRLDLVDGTTIGLTSFNRDIDFDLDVDDVGPVTYCADVGEFSDVDLPLGLEPSNFEVSGPFGDIITLEAAAGGRFGRAVGWLFQINPKHPDWGVIPILFGNVSNVKVEGARWTFELRSEADRLNQVVGHTITPQCKADFGDEHCTVVPETLDVTVIAIEDELTFSVSFAGASTDDYFNFGKVSWLTGALAGTRPMEVFDWTADGQVTLLLPTVDVPAIGDTAVISRGCSKVRQSTDPSVPTCRTYNNVVNMWKAFPDLPGNDQVLKPAHEGQGNG